ncbi:hypothetical protein VTK73DRAFT_9685 [Phialemonium thermophilum]|uniref:Cellobiose dehydrogenase-like cytochrome domain-containing protein n=1 Tax=Phialemonium thermophilum TaxID=223376 RepID=A0ABR3W110_9PEZI
MFRAGDLAAGALVLAAYLTCPCVAQDPEMTPGVYADAATGITFTTWSAPLDENGDGTYTFGMVLPADAATRNATEYLGYLKCQIKNADHTGWCGVAHGGHMTDDLLLMAWPYLAQANVTANTTRPGGKRQSAGGTWQVLTSFRWATDYFPPGPYNGSSNGNATAGSVQLPILTQISSRVDFGGGTWELLYRCQNCFAWSQDGWTESVATAVASGGGDDGGSGAELVLGHAQSFDGPQGNAGCPDSIVVPFHDNGYGQWAASLANVSRPEYKRWASLATSMSRGSCR